MGGGRQPYKPTWDKLSYAPSSLVCAYFGLAMSILPTDGVLGQKGGFPHLEAACSKPWPARLLRVPEHRVTSREINVATAGLKPCHYPCCLRQGDEGKLFLGPKRGTSCPFAAPSSEVTPQAHV